MEELLTFLNYPTMQFAGQMITVAQWVFLPLLLFFGYLLTKWLSRLISSRLTAKNVDADVIHLIRRLFYVLAIIILIITTLDLINVPITAFAFFCGAVAIINNFIFDDYQR